MSSSKMSQWHRGSLCGNNNPTFIAKILTGYFQEVIEALEIWKLAAFYKNCYINIRFFRCHCIFEVIDENSLCLRKYISNIFKNEAS